MKKKAPKRPTHDPKPTMGGGRYKNEPMMMGEADMKKKMKRMGMKRGMK